MKFLDIEGITDGVSAIGLGTAQFGSKLDRDLSFRLLDQFVDLGGNFLDSARVYGAWDRGGANGGSGNSERVLGEWLKQRGKRDQVLIATKGGHPDFETGASHLTQAKLAEEVDGSLRLLGVDTIDMYWLHRDDRSIPVDNMLGWMAAPIRAGKIRSLGVCHWRPDRLDAARAYAKETGLPLCSANQIAWSLAEQTEKVTQNRFGEQLSVDASMRDCHIRHMLPIVAYSSQAGGFFAEKYDIIETAPQACPKKVLVQRYGSPANIRRRIAARRIATERGVTANQVALAWLLQQPFPSAALIGPRNAEDLTDSLAATSFTLTGEEMGRLA